MDIVVRQSGGVFGLEQKIEVRGKKLTVTDAGASRRESLDPADHATLQAQAEVLLRESSPIKHRKGSRVADVMRTEVVIDDGAGRSRQIQFESGDSVPVSFRHFVRSVVGLASER